MQKAASFEAAFEKVRWLCLVLTVLAIQNKANEIGRQGNAVDYRKSNVQGGGRLQKGGQRPKNRAYDCDKANDPKEMVVLLSLILFHICLLTLKNGETSSP